MYMLDTNICIYIIKKRPPDVLTRFETMQNMFVSVSVVTFAELQYGVEKSAAKQHNQHVLEAFLSNVLIMSWDKDAGVQYARLRSHLESRGTPIGNMDMLIAAHAISQNAVLVTHNRNEFKRIPQLQMEDWAPMDES